ncbi:MAG: hypothetical protein ACD_46C00541G0004 [uncultured bacterium]|nr:MAG: hypothetical protein ACD_46C00541G0004 [uncultured bacterium]
MRLSSKLYGLMGLILFVLCVNMPVIVFNMVYPEQSLIYLANQKIHHVSDLIHVYLHPQLFHAVVPFFRPTGHFVIYQLLAPIVGWHQQRAFFVVNFLFLAGAGFYLIQIYRKLFPGYFVGGLIAFAIYLMHPSLTLVRFIILHFEFAYIFFSLMGFYYFILFCQQNKFDQTKIKSISLLIWSLLCYVIATTFKESAVMMAAIYALYFVITFYSVNLYKNKQAIELLLLLACLGIVLGLYLISAWSLGYHPAKKIMTMYDIRASAKDFLRYVFNIQLAITPKEAERNYQLLWRTTAFTPIATAIMWLGSLLTMGVIYKTASFPRKRESIAVDPRLRRDEVRYSQFYQHNKSIIFLLSSAILFLIIPLFWGEGMPWHFNLTLIMLSMLMGFSVEYCCHRFFKKNGEIIGYSLALLIGLSTLLTNQLSIQQYQEYPVAKLVLKTLRNAIFYPPNIKNQLRDDSLIVIEDNTINNSYLLGAGAYPFYLANYSEYIKHDTLHKNDFITTVPSFNGSLFRWAYAKPAMSEEVVPFQIELMAAVENEIVYQWLLHYKNIFCLSYDENGEWHDKTKEFKAKLLEEQKRRHMIVHEYYPLKKSQKIIMTQKKNLPFPDVNLCRYLCDQRQPCDGFFYTANQVKIECDFYRMFN